MVAGPTWVLAANSCVMLGTALIATSCKEKPQTPAPPAEMRMLVEPQRPSGPHSALLLLGLVLGAAAGLTCVGNAYPKDGKCCHDCPPGYGMESRCSGGLDTQCLPCPPGFYNEATNYEPCKPCTQCNQTCPEALAALAFPPTVPASSDPPGSGSEAKRRCPATQDTVCSCDDQACKPWTNCTLMGKRTVRPASQSSDAVCEDRSSPATLPWETQGPPAWHPTTQPTTAWTGASQGPFTPPTEPPRGPQLAAVLGLGLGLLAPVAAALALLLHHRAWRLPPSGNSFRTPIQEEHADANSTLAKI
ncbi:hypothetical protein PANDA_020165 [Ailuropoda melanoleuca]|uniref:TNFR-Cys domain-containing protein n=1 Tax=Ailuropoda melanoleuca TaxID=9646 RepID=D2I3Q1_AILME|nr:hypothetical protein PANDA_020165 [Ailuropoda melanoleuca]